MLCTFPWMIKKSSALQLLGTIDMMLFSWIGRRLT